MITKRHWDAVRSRQAGHRTGWFWFLGGYLLFGSGGLARAQIVPDTSLPQNSVVTPTGTTLEITGGTAAGNNLFHSFAQFSVPTGGVAAFNQASTVENIISRVTGPTISNIDGLIRANGTANLFLINPNGIIFGRNAALNIGGSWVGSTANSIRFADGSEFSAVNPASSPLLTISVPIGLQYGPKPGAIHVQGEGHNLSFNSLDDPVVNRTKRPPGLQVNPGQTLALVGGQLTLAGGNLTAAGGRIALGSVGAAGMVTLTPTNPGWQLGYGNIGQFQDIQLTQAASLEASGNSGGSIQVQGRRISLTETSALMADTLGAGVGGTLTITGSESVQIRGVSLPPAGALFMSRLSTDVAPGASGQGGNLTIATGRLLIAEGAQISSATFGAGNAGTLAVVAQTVDIVGDSPLGASGLLMPVTTGATGQGGNLTITTDRLRISDGGQVAASTFGAGKAGNLTIGAHQIELVGTSLEAEEFASGIFANVEAEATGNGGNLLISTKRLQITDGAQVSTSTFGDGNAGSLTVNAQDIEVRGESSKSSSGLIAISRGSGNGGNLLIETDRLRLTDGAQIATATGGAGNAGDLTVRATQSVELVGATELGRSGLFSSAIVGTGNGGDLTVATDRLIVRDGATVSVSNFSSRNPDTPPGQGAAGNLNVNANFVLLDQQGILTAEAAANEGGNITLQTGTLLLRRGSAITTNAQGPATGGNIILNTDILAALENSDITANAQQSFGGRVMINATSILGTEFRAQPTTASDVTASSALGAEFNGVVELNTPDVDPSRGLAELPNDLADRSSQVTAVCAGSGRDEFVITGRGGLPEAPAQILRDGTVWEDLRPRQPSPQPIGRLPLTARPAPPTAIVEAQGWLVDAQGQVTLVAQRPLSPLPPAIQCASSLE
jgi:filamentous hemagglutinin family protein